MFRFNSIFLIVLMTVGPLVLAGNSHYPDNHPPLKDKPFTALPLGSVRAQGWLLKQLEMQRDGLTGHAETALVELNETNAWLGGDKENWEKGPYYLRGLIVLAYTLDDATLKQRAQKWIDAILSRQRDDGYSGPANNDDWWPRIVVNYLLRDYYEATGDARVLPFLTKYYRYMLATLPKRPLKDWAKARAGDEMDSAIWLYNRTREPFLIELIDLLRSQAYDWPTIMRENTFQGFGTDFHPKHNVNVPQAMKMPVVSWQRSGDDRERDAIDVGFGHLMRENGLSIGMQSGTEFLSGRSSGQGIEFCSFVEQMLSDETIVRITGDAKYADRLEQIAFNGLPAGWNRDLTALHYYTLPNHVIAKLGTQGFGQDYHNGTVFGPRSGCPCCCFNVHMGWPKFAQNSWAATSDNGLAVIAYAPSVVTARVGEGEGAMATIAQDTRYPFDDEIRFKLTLSKPTSFPLMLRTPGWCEAPTITVNGQRVEAAKPGAFAKLARGWKTGDEVVVKLPMNVRVTRGVHDSASVHRGPLLYALRIDADKHVVGQPGPGYDEYEQNPTSAWNYALAIDAKEPSKSFEVVTSRDAKPDPNPFAPDDTPVKLIATARRLPQWGLAWNGVVALDPPASPVSSSEPQERVTLIPFGAAELRVTDFPLLGDVPPKRGTPRVFNFDSNDTTGWTWYGGGWWAHEGKLRTSFTGGASGFKALVDGFTAKDVQIEADVTPPPLGDAGVVFRVTKPSVGADAYEGYYAGISASTGEVMLGRADGRTWTPLKVVRRSIPHEVGTRIRVTARGKHLEVRVNDEPNPVISIDDSQWTTGQVGVRMYTTDNDHAVAEFDEVRISTTEEATR